LKEQVQKEKRKKTNRKGKEVFQLFVSLIVDCKQLTKQRKGQTRTGLLLERNQISSEAKHFLLLGTS